VQRGQTAEDFGVELKLKWPDDFERYARQLAGQANAARGEPVVWVIGVDERGAVKGSSFVELSSWSTQLFKHFVGPKPECILDLAMEVEGQGVHALCFATDRAPYLIGRREERLEVPWRHVTGAVSASHEQLLSILAPRQKHPRMDFHLAEVALTNQTHEGQLAWRLRGQVFVVPQTSEPLYATKARSRVHVLAGGREVFEGPINMLTPVHTQQESEPAIAISYPRFLNFTADALGDLFGSNPPDRVDLRFDLIIEPFAEFVSSSVSLLREQEKAASWTFNSGLRW
jgi:hypothetical protein